MAVPLDDLNPAFRILVEKTLAACAAKGVMMIPYQTVRSPYEQGKIWRQSRTIEEVTGKIARLNSKGAAFLAHCIESVGPQDGKHVTDAIPGYSWHQWSESVDCFWSLNGKSEWSTSRLGHRNGYRIYAEQGTKAGLTSGGYWQSFQDWPHLQKRRANSPARAGYSLRDIDRVMRDIFG